MSNQAIAHNYAQAFFNAGQDAGVLELIREDVRLLKECVYTGASLLSRLSSPGFSQADRLKIMEKALGEHVSGLTRNFLLLIVHHRRQNLLPIILDELDNIINKNRQVLKASLTSARQLSSNQQQKMHQILQKRTGCTFDIQFRIDPKLLAGFVLVYEEKMYDCSTIGALNRFRDTLKSLR